MPPLNLVPSIAVYTGSGCVSLVITGESFSFSLAGGFGGPTSSGIWLSVPAADEPAPPIGLPFAST